MEEQQAELEKKNRALRLALQVRCMR